MKQKLPFIIIVGVLGVALLTMWYLQRSTAKTPRAVSRETSLDRSTLVKPGADPAHVLGATNAAVMLEEFGDFECHSCGLLHPILKTLKGEFGANLVIVFREFPLASHAHSLEAAKAAEAAGLQGKFWEMHDLLYENQATWHEASDVGPIFEEYATRIGLVPDRFKQGLSSEIVIQRISSDRERGYSIGINSTPTLFLNGREVQLESMAADKLRALIAGEIKSGGGK